MAFNVETFVIRLLYQQYLNNISVIIGISQNVHIGASLFKGVVHF